MSFMRQVLKSKIHRAVVTEANVNYEGSITIDEVLMRAANILEYERVLVVDVDNGERFETYVVRGVPGSGIVCVNGAAARLVQVGDKVIIMSWAMVVDGGTHTDPKVVKVTSENGLKHGN